jgi:hypothetical protein
MPAKKPVKKIPAEHQYVVYMGSSFGIVVARSVADAREQLLLDMGCERKPWVARDWRIHRASEDERRRYAALADASRGSQPTAKTAKKPPVPRGERLF